MFHISDTHTSGQLNHTTSNGVMLFSVAVKVILRHHLSGFSSQEPAKPEEKTHFWRKLWG